MKEFEMKFDGNFVEQKEICKKYNGETGDVEVVHKPPGMKTVKEDVKIKKNGIYDDEDNLLISRQTVEKDSLWKLFGFKGTRKNIEKFLLEWHEDSAEKLRKKVENDIKKEQKKEIKKVCKKLCGKTRFAWNALYKQSLGEELFKDICTQRKEANSNKSIIDYILDDTKYGSKIVIFLQENKYL